jgi:hypothetical protein
MPEITSCPTCDKKLKLPENLMGKTVRCPGCNVMFTAQPDAPAAPREQPAPREEPVARRPAAPAPHRESLADRRPAPLPRREPLRREDEDEYDRPRPRPRRDDEDDGPRRRDDEYDDRPRRRDEDDDDGRPSRSAAAGGWRGTRMGSFLVVIANWIFLAAVGIGMLGFGILLLAGASLFSSMANAPPNNQAAAQAAATSAASGLAGFIILGVTVGILYFIHVALQLTGQGLCMQVPNRRGKSLRGLAIAGFSCSCAALVISVGVLAVNTLISARGGNAGVSGGSLQGILQTTGFVCWVLFLRMAAVEMGDDRLGGRFVFYLISVFAVNFLFVILLIIVVCAGGVAMISAMSNSNNPSPGDVAATGGGVLILGVLVVGLWCLTNLGLTVWYIFLLQQLRGQIDRRLARM